MATKPANVDQNTDRRIQRTRRLLRQAFIDVSREKSFRDINIQDITERANVNRGTFYAHFSDKYDLLDIIIREEFTRQIVSNLPPIEQWERGTLRLLIKIVLEYFDRVHRRCQTANALNPLIEHAAHEELIRLLLMWLERDGKVKWRVPLETIAQVMGWAIFGAAIRWSGETTSLSSEQMASDVFLVMMEGVEHLASNTLP